MASKTNLTKFLTDIAEGSGLDYSIEKADDTWVSDYLTAKNCIIS